MQSHSLENFGAQSIDSFARWVEARRAKVGPPNLAESRDLRQYILHDPAEKAANQSISVDLSYPPDRLGEAIQILEILDALGYRVTAEQADWIEPGSTAVMIWWKSKAEAKAHQLFERIQTVEGLDAMLWPEPSTPKMVGDIQIALGRDF